MLESGVADDWNEVWLPRLRELCASIRAATRACLARALGDGAPERVARPVGQGAGDVTYGLDLPSEELCTRWLEETARERPLSLLTEDAGWRHRGPDPTGDGSVELPGFDHGGPRIALDPVDGTRNLMTDLRPAWTAVGYAPPGAGEPRLADLTGGLLSEIPDTRARFWRSLEAATGGGCRFAERPLEGDGAGTERALSADGDDRVDHGYFPFFGYMPDLAPELARIEADFFARAAAEEGADVRNCYDDQYISNAGQLALLALGTYRMIADLRAWLADRRGRPTITSKPYDVAGAIVCARAAGCVVTAPGGGALDFPLDATAPVAFVGWHNPATRARLEPHLVAAIARPASSP